MSTQPIIQPRWMSLAAAAAYSSLSRRTISRMIEAGRLQAHKPNGGRVLIEKRQLHEVIRRSTMAPRSGSR
jgi:excisionase family DNA binding protein